MSAPDLQRVLIATQNAGKVAEMRRLLCDIPAKFVGLDELASIEAPEENGATFLENATIKARYYAEHTGEIALADDSGLVVDALDGAPGVLSARYGGPGLTDADRTRHLLDQMRNVDYERRTARFQCAVVVYDPSDGGTLLHTKGTVEGSIAFAPRGSNGFGYDPVFVPEGHSLTTAEMSADAKDALSHRGRAVRAIAPKLRAHLSEL